ncbi:MAG TPA: cytochrome P450 [Xanthobacteraceae bacterium]|nr:cytochrome P450 [Xanthobacteraceae bacterium]
MFIDPDLIPFEPPPQPLGLRGLPLIWRNYIETIPRLAYEKQGVICIKRRWSEVILLCEPQLIGELLVDKAEDFERDIATRRSFAPVIGDSSLFLAEGADWRWQRRAVAPVFRHDTLLSFVPVFAAMAERQIERWRSLRADEPTDVAAAMTRTTFDIIVETVLGGSATLDADRYGRALTVSFETLPWHLIYAMFSLPAWLPFPHRRRAMQARDFLHADIGRIVAARRAQVCGNGASPRADLLDLLLAARDPDSGRIMSDAEVTMNLLTFIIAGHETTAVALTWMLWLLAKDQATQQRVADEVAAVAGGKAIGPDDVERLNFTRQAIQEAMRLYPPAAALSRHPKTELAFAGMTLNRRTRVHVPIYALHRNAQIWDAPNAFDPDRFAPDKVKARPRYAYLPFGGGPRICIGAGFAMTEAAAVLGTLVRAFRFRPVSGHKPKPLARVTLRPDGGMPLHIAPR